MKKRQMGRNKWVMENVCILVRVSDTTTILFYSHERQYHLYLRTFSFVKSELPEESLQNQFKLHSSFLSAKIKSRYLIETHLRD